MLAENEVGNIWKRLAVFVNNDTIDDRKFDVWVVGRHLLHDRALCKADSDDKVKILLGKGPHRRFDRRRITRFDIVKTYVKIMLGPLYAFPRGRVERAVILAADVKNDAYSYLAAFAFSLSAL